MTVNQAVNSQLLSRHPPPLHHFITRDANLYLLLTSDIRIIMSGSEHPEQEDTWVVLNDEDGSFNVTLPLGFGNLILMFMPHLASNGFLSKIYFG